jgi:hypothetical protein
VFAELAGRTDAWRPALEGWDMRESQIVQEWQAQARAEGRAEGREEGEVRRARAVIVRALQVRFGNVPEDVRARVENEGDLALLQGWFDLALTANSLAEFQAALAVGSNGASPPTP